MGYKNASIQILNGRQISNVVIVKDLILPFFVFKGLGFFLLTVCIIMLKDY